LGEFFVSDAGLSTSLITRLTKSWQEERERFADRSLADVDYVYCGTDGVHFNVDLARNPTAVRSSSASAQMAPRRSSRSPMACGSRREAART
jgi:hypothetical protein